MTQFNIESVEALRSNMIAEIARLERDLAALRAKLSGVELVLSIIKKCEDAVWR